MLGFVAPGPGTRILDVGCGIGNFSALFSEAGATVVATDFAESMVSATRRRYGTSFPILRSSADAIPHADASFDVVIALDVIEHLYDPGRFLTEVRRVLRPGGTLVLSTDRDGMRLGILNQIVATKVKRILRALIPDRLVAARRGRIATPSRPVSGGTKFRSPLCTHVHEFALDELRELLTSQGFVSDRLDTYPHWAEFGRWGTFVEAAARGPLREYKWEYVLLKVRLRES